MFFTFGEVVNPKVNVENFWDSLKERLRAMRKFGDCYIDLGTANTLVYSSQALQVNEPTVLTARLKCDKIYDYSAFGQYAKKMVGKTPLFMSSIAPLKEGVIADFESTLKLMNFFLRRQRTTSFYRKTRLLISLPCHVTHYERESIRELGIELGASRVDLLSEPMAAAIGTGLDVLGSSASMIVDIGGGTSEAAVLTLGGTVASFARRVGGNSLETDIIRHLREQYKFEIGPQTAEFLKMSIGRAFLRKNLDKRVQIAGIHRETGLPEKFTVSSGMIARPVDRFVEQIVDIIRRTFEQCPPEVIGDISCNGIILAGGGALLSGLPERISQSVGVRVIVAKDPLYAVVRGGARVLDDHKFFDRLEVG